MRHDHNHDHDDDEKIEFDQFDEDELIAEILAMEGVEAPEDTNDDEDHIQPPVKPTIAEVVAVFESDARNLSYTTIAYGLSDISHSQLEELHDVWQTLPVDAKRAILLELIETQETEFQLNYNAFATYNLTDNDPRIRQSAIDLLWEDESLSLMEQLIEIALHDDNRDVRASATSALGRFVLLGELDKLPKVDATRVLEAVLYIWQNSEHEIDVKRRALESLANSSHPSVKPAIESAYQSGYIELQTSALFAMGRTADIVWENIIIDELSSDEPSKRYEAIRAAGELGLISAVQRLAEVILDDDPELTSMAIWALGEIGGGTAVRVLEMLMEQAENADDEAMIEVIEDALGSALLSSELDDLDFE